MPDLLIHSMSEFSDIIVEALSIAGAKEVVEIGAEFGGMSTILADHAAANDGHLTSIDPCPKPEFVQWVAAQPHVRHIAAPSLDALPGCPAGDAWLIDGDHNWYTVYHELHAIDASSRRAGKPLLAFLHDIGWPCARRDMYYAPDRIPAAHRHPHSFDAGALPGHSPLLPRRGFRGMGQFAWATHEGGPRNGVLTAVEDFLEEARGRGATLAFAEVPAVFGLGIVFDTSAPWAEELTALVIPFHENRLLRRLEENRLVNYLTVIDWQDRVAAARAA